MICHVALLLGVSLLAAACGSAVAASGTPAAPTNESVVASGATASSDVAEPRFTIAPMSIQFREGPTLSLDQDGNLSIVEGGREAERLGRFHADGGFSLEDEHVQVVDDDGNVTFGDARGGRVVGVTLECADGQILAINATGNIEVAAGIAAHVTGASSPSRKRTALVVVFISAYMIAAAAGYSH